MKDKIKLNTFITYSFLIIVTEIIFKILMFHKLNIISLLYTIIFSLPIITLLGILTNLTKKKITIIIYYITLVFITFLYLFQYVFYKLFSVTFSFLTIGLAGQAADFKSIVVDSIKMYYGPIILLLIPLIITIIASRFIKIYEFRKKALILWPLILIVTIAIS